VKDVAWHLIGLFEEWRQSGVVQLELRNGAMWVVPVPAKAIVANVLSRKVKA